MCKFYISLIMLATFCLVACSDENIEKTNKNDEEEITKKVELKDNELLITVDGEDKILEAKKEMMAMGKSMKVVETPLIEKQNSSGTTRLTWDENSTIGPLHLIVAESTDFGFNGSFDEERERFRDSQWIERIHRVVGEDVDLSALNLQDDFDFGVMGQTNISLNELLNEKPTIVYNMLKYNPEKKTKYVLWLQYPVEAEENPEFLPTVLAMIESLGLDGSDE